MFDKDLETIVKLYAGIGATEVWRSWRDKMLGQKREVDWKLLDLPIPDQDLELASTIAEDIARDFIVWLEAHTNYKLINTSK